MTTTRKKLAQALAEACPLDDGRTYKVADVERILAVFGDVLIAQLATDGVLAVDIPGVCKITRSPRAAAKSHFDNASVIPAGWTLRAAITKNFKKLMKEKAKPPADA
jgi:hypothetical protein